MSQKNTSNMGIVAPVAPTDEERFARLGYAVVLFGFFGFLAWAIFAPLSSAVIAQAVIKVDSTRKTVQHLDGGIVDSILVRDGDTVTAGDVMIRLDGTRAAAEMAIVETAYRAALAQEARLSAERDRRDDLLFAAELDDNRDDPEIASLISAQESLFAARRSTLQGQLGIIDQQIVFLEDDIKGQEAQLAAKDGQIAILTEEIVDLRGLFADGLTDKTRVLALERERAEMEGARGEHLSAVAAARTQIGERNLEQYQLQNSFHEEVVSELKQIQVELRDLAERRAAAKHTLDHIDIRAPVSGVVVGLRVHTIGGIIGPGETVLEVVPSGDRLIVEGRIQPQDIDRVEVGLDARVKFTAFEERFNPQLTGTVSYVSADVIEDERTGISYFLARIEVSDDEILKLDGKRVQPGMSADVFIQTGKRTPAQFLTKPLVDSFHRAWREG